MGFKLAGEGLIHAYCDFAAFKIISFTCFAKIFDIESVNEMILNISLDKAILQHKIGFSTCHFVSLRLCNGEEPPKTDKERPFGRKEHFLRVTPPSRHCAVIVKKVNKK
jgi:hypothetical protein